MTPLTSAIGIALLFLMAVAPVLPWRKASQELLRDGRAAYFDRLGGFLGLEGRRDPADVRSNRGAGAAAATFVWAAVPYRMEWRYAHCAHRVMLMDVGHICQNLYLAVEAIGGGCCAIAAYHQEKMDALLELDGEEEFTIYLAPVGKV